MEVMSTATDLSIGERLRCVRLRRGLTQTVLAGLVGRSPRWLMDVEHGVVDPRMSDAVRLAAALGVELVDLIPLTTATPSVGERAAPGGG